MEDSLITDGTVTAALQTALEASEHHDKFALYQTDPAAHPEIVAARMARVDADAWNGRYNLWYPTDTCSASRMQAFAQSIVKQWPLKNHLNLFVYEVNIESRRGGMTDLYVRMHEVMLPRKDGRRGGLYKRREDWHEAKRAAMMLGLVPVEIVDDGARA